MGVIFRLLHFRISGLIDVLRGVREKLLPAAG